MYNNNNNNGEFRALSHYRLDVDISRMKIPPRQKFVQFATMIERYSVGMVLLVKFGSRFWPVLAVDERNYDTRHMIKNKGDTNLIQYFGDHSVHFINKKNTNEVKPFKGNEHLIDFNAEDSGTRGANSYMDAIVEFGQYLWGPQKKRGRFLGVNMPNLNLNLARM